MRSEPLKAGQCWQWRRWLGEVRSAGAQRERERARCTASLVSLESLVSEVTRPPRGAAK
jgi:hypothetical protein